MICYTSSITIKIAPVADVPEPGCWLEYVGGGVGVPLDWAWSTWELPGRRTIKSLSGGRFEQLKRWQYEYLAGR